MNFSVHFFFFPLRICRRKELIARSRGDLTTNETIQVILFRSDFIKIHLVQKEECITVTRYWQ